MPPNHLSDSSGNIPYSFTSAPLSTLKRLTAEGLNLICLWKFLKFLGGSLFLFTIQSHVSSNSSLPFSPISAGAFEDVTFDSLMKPAQEYLRRGRNRIGRVLFIRWHFWWPSSTAFLRMVWQELANNVLVTRFRKLSAQCINTLLVYCQFTLGCSCNLFPWVVCIFLSPKLSRVRMCFSSTISFNGFSFIASFSGSCWAFINGSPNCWHTSMQLIGFSSSVARDI